MSEVPFETGLRVKFKSSHPHGGEIGVSTGKSIQPGGAFSSYMHEFELENCKHGTKFCFARLCQTVEARDKK